MKSRATQGLTSALAACTILAFSAGQVSAAEHAQTDPVDNPAAYANYLRHSNEAGAEEVLKEFQALKPSEQNRFVNYLQDPSLLKEFLDQAAGQDGNITPTSGNINNSTSLKNGDATFTAKRTITGVAAKKKPLKGNHTATYTTHIKLLGIKIIQFKIWVNFHSNGRDITKVNYADGSKKNFSGAISISKGIPKTWRSNWGWCPVGGGCSGGHNANASIVWEGSVVFKGSTFQIDKKQSIQSNIHGTTKGSLKTA